MGTNLFLLEILKFPIVAIFLKKIPSFAVKYRGRDDTITSRGTERAADRARDDEDKSSRIRVGGVIPIDSHRKRLTERDGFRAPHGTRRRHVPLVEQPKDEVGDEVGDGVVSGDVVGEVAEEVVGEVVASGQIVGLVAEEVARAGEIARVVVDEVDVGGLSRC